MPKRKSATPDWPTRLKALRARLGFNTREAAEFIRVSRSLWSLWENGKRIPEPYHQLLIDLAFACDDEVIPVDATG